MFLFVVACLIVSVSADCCSPDEWHSDLGFVTAMHSSNGTAIYEGTSKYAVDYNAGMSYQVQNVNVDGVNVQQTIVTDDNNSLTYIITKDGCQRYRNDAPLPKCLKGEAAYLIQGLGDNSVKSMSYHVTMPEGESYITVTADTCVPESEVILYRSNGVSVYTTAVIKNVKAGIADRSGFSIPPSCMSSPIQPTIPGLGKRSFF